MFEEIKTHVLDWNDETAIREYLTKIVDKKAFDNTGLIYGLGHAVYTKSDPRQVILKDYAKQRNAFFAFGCKTGHKSGYN